MEIALLYLAVFHRDFQAQCRTDAIDGAALQLCFNCLRVDGKTTVDCCHDAFDLQLPLRADRNFDRMRGVSAEGKVGGKTDTMSIRPLFLVIDALGDKFN